MVIIAYVVEKLEKKKNGVKERTLTTRKIAMIGVFSAIAAVLHVMDFPIPFAPDFYKLDFSELPALIGAFAFGPVAAVMIEFCKIVLKLLFKGTSTAFVGDLANFIIGCTFLLPASIIYLFRKNKKNAVIGCVVGTLVMTIFGTAFNAVYLLPQICRALWPSAGFHNRNGPRHQPGHQQREYPCCIRCGAHEHTERRHCVHSNYADI